MPPIPSFLIFFLGTLLFCKHDPVNQLIYKNITKFDLIMNNPKVIKRTAQFIVTWYDVRCKQLFNEIDFNVNNYI